MDDPSSLGTTPPPMDYNAALVTGASARLGRAMALGLARRGVDVALHYNASKSDAEATAQDVRALGVSCVTLQADLLDEGATHGLIDRARAGLGRNLDVLINNASLFEYDNMDSASKDSWDKNLGTNLRAPVILSQMFAKQAPSAIRQGDGEMCARACIINMIDQRVKKLTKHYTTYTLGKAGLWTFTQTCAQALGPDIRVNGIGPGSALQGADQPDDQYRSHRDDVPLQRGANAEDIVQAMNFLLDARAFTGQLLCVDGGMHL